MLVPFAIGLSGVLAKHGDVTGAALAIALEDLGRGRLACPVGAEEGEDLAGYDFEIKPPDSLEIAVGLAQPSNRNDRLAHRTIISRRRPPIQPLPSAAVIESGEQGPRVAVAFHEVILGGATRSVLRIVPLLEERGWSFSFWAPKPSELYDHLVEGGWDVDGAPRCIEYSLRTWRLPPGPARRLIAAPGYLRRYRRFLQTRRPALVHANSILSLAEALVASRSGLPTLLHAHEMLPPDLRGRMLRRAAWRNLDQIVAVSETSGARLDWRGRRPRIVHEATPIPEPRRDPRQPTPVHGRDRCRRLQAQGQRPLRRGSAGAPPPQRQRVPL